jgi:hypothetical protein
VPLRHGRGSVVTQPPSGKPSLGLVSWIALGAACVWVLDLAVLRGGAPHPLDDTWEYGLVAKSLLAGHGFRTPMIHPPLWGLRDTSLTVPVLVHGPLLPMIAVPFVALLGPATIDYAAWLAAAFAVLAAVFTARAVGRLKGATAGACAAALVTLSPIMLRMVHHDIAPAAGACASAWVMDLVARPRPRALIAGLVTGAGALVRPELLLAAPSAAAAMGAGRLPHYVLGLLLLAGPWASRAFIVTGSFGFNLSSYLLIAYTATHPGLSPLWDFEIPPWRWPTTLFASLPELPAKWLHFAPRAIKHLLMSPAPGLGLVSGFGAFAAWRAPETRRWAWAALGVAAIPLALVTTTESSERYVAVFLPLWAAGAVYGVDVLARNAAIRVWARAALLVAAAPFWLTALSTEARQSAALRHWLATERAALASRSSDDLRLRLMFSDTPDFVVWTTGRPTVATTREAYLEWPAGADTRSRPSTGEPMDEWFHVDVRGRPAPTGGGSAAESVSDGR